MTAEEGCQRGGLGPRPHICPIGTEGKTRAEIPWCACQAHTMERVTVWRWFRRRQEWRCVDCGHRLAH